MEQPEKQRKRERLWRALRWLAPSAVSACAGALFAGALEAHGLGWITGAYATGFIALVGMPVLFATSVIVRGLWAAWQPIDLVDEGGAAPRLAGWIATLWLAALALAWAMFQGTWILAGITAFKPVSLSFAEPILAVSAALLLVITSRPLARGLSWIYRKLDARWRKRFTRPLVTPWRIAVGTAVRTLALGYVVWRVWLRARIGTFDFGVFAAPLAAIGGTSIVHFAWRRFARWRRLVGLALGGAAIAAIGLALFAWQLRPTATLTIWGERPLAGLTIDKLFDLDAIRAGMSLTAFRPVERPGASHPDIVLVTIDTVRADHTPPYGGSAEMPVVRDLGVRGAVFEYAFSPSNVTRRSIPSMVTGLAPNRVRGRVVGWALRIDPRHVLLAERLLAGGYETAGFVCCEGFWGKDFRTGLQRGLQHLEIEPLGGRLATRAHRWVEQREAQPHRKPLFIWMHVLEPHNWQAASGAPHNDDERRRFYDRSLTAADAMLVQLLGAFSQRPPERAPIVIVASDHGEALGEHGQPYHSTDLYNSQIRVPFVIAGPGIAPGRIDETVSLTDLTPTVLDLAGFTPPTGPSMDGRSLADLATGRRPSNDAGTAFAAMIKDRSNPGGLIALIRGRWKMIDNGTTIELYDVHGDIDEKSNIATNQPQIFSDLRRLLQQHVKASSRSPF